MAVFCLIETFIGSFTTCINLQLLQFLDLSVSDTYRCSARFCEQVLLVLQNQTTFTSFHVGLILTALFQT